MSPTIKFSDKEYDEVIALKKLGNKLKEIGTFNEKDFNEHNIFDIKHPEHKELLKIINKDYQYDKHDWGNLTDFITD